MRADLLGPDYSEQEQLIAHEEDPRGLMFTGLPTSIQLGSDFEEKLSRLVARSLSPGFSVSPPRPKDLSDDERKRLDEASASIAEEPNNVDARLDRARLLLTANRVKDAAIDARVILTNHCANLDAMLISAECYLTQLPMGFPGAQFVEVMREVIEPLNNYLVGRPKDLKARHMRAHVRMMVGDLAGSEADLKAILESDPQRLASRALLGDVYRKQKAAAKAVDETDRVLSVSPGNLLAQLTRLEVLSELHRWQEIAAVSPQALQIAPGHPRIIRLYGTALNYTGRSKEVLNFDKQYKDAGPSRLAALVPLAKAELTLGEYFTALKYADEFLARVPSDPEANLVRVQSLAGSGRWEEALALGVTAFCIPGPSGAESEELLRLLRTAYKRRGAGPVSKPTE
jgi:tetratricopeptide (TPR) repeat protein